MIYVNGYVQQIEEQSGLYDATGAPTASRVSYGDPIPCMWLATIEDKQGVGRDNGYTRLAYTVHIEPRPISCRRMRLLRLSGEVVGDLVVQSVQEALLHSFTQIRLA